MMRSSNVQLQELTYQEVGVRGFKKLKFYHITVVVSL